MFNMNQSVALFLEMKQPNKAGMSTKPDPLQALLNEDICEKLAQNHVALRRHYHLLIDALLIENALRECNGNKSEAARRIGMSRQTFGSKFRANKEVKKTHEPKPMQSWEKAN